jgi:hypothetical protein
MDTGPASKTQKITDMTDRTARLQELIAPLREKIVRHPVYRSISTVEDVRIFMEYHVFAVWDFMSLLKSLQQSLTCTSVPWFPVGNAGTRYLINEIVTGEESDVDPNGTRISHYELYLRAMRQCGADCTGIEKFTGSLQQQGDLQQAFKDGHVAQAARNFVDFTFRTIASGKDHVKAAIFTFGREDLIPGMFVSMVRDLNMDFPDTIGILKYYLERHIEIDGDHHSQLALEMTASLCGNDDQRWEEAEEATVQCLRKRLELWDGIYERLAGPVLQENLLYP